MSDPVEMPARDFTFEVNVGTDAVPDWLAIGGFNNWTQSPVSNDVDTTKFSDNGRLSHMKISRGDEFAMTGFYLEDPDDGTVDPGQAACETWGQELAHASRRLFRITSDITGKSKTFKATATVTVSGGGNDDVQTFELAITVTGSITSSGAEAALIAPVAPTGTDAAGFTVVTITDPVGGTGIDKYEVVLVDAATGLTVQNTVQASNDPIYVTAAAGNHKVKARAHNKAGWSPFSPLSASITTS